MTRSPVFRSAVLRAATVCIGSVALLGAVACGAGAPPEADPAAATTSQAPAEGQAGHGGHGGAGVPSPALYAVQTAPLGVILTDGSGRLIYRSATDSASPPTSNCTDACTETWIPIVADPAEELELAGVSEALVGRLVRADGTSQLTLAGWPLYRHLDDEGTLATAGHHGEDGRWFVVTPTGEQAATP